MEQKPFDFPNNPYEEKNYLIGEQLCQSLKQCKMIFDKDPFFSFSRYIPYWSKNFVLYKDLIETVIEAVRNSEEFKPRIKPNEFKKNIPVFKSIEKGQCLYSVPFIRQYKNASIVQFNIDRVPNDRLNSQHIDSYFELSLGEQYECRRANSSDSMDHSSINFIVSPALPDDLSGIEIIFKEYNTPFKYSSTGLEIIIKI